MTNNEERKPSGDIWIGLGIYCLLGPVSGLIGLGFALIIWPLTGTLMLRRADSAAYVVLLVGVIAWVCGKKHWGVLKGMLIAIAVTALSMAASFGAIWFSATKGGGG